ncbi:hypothetical protein Bca4012_041910 [Brassica carinata]
MNNESGNSSGVSSARARWSRCWCAEEILVWGIGCLLNVKVNRKSLQKILSVCFCGVEKALSFRIGKLEQTILAERVEEEMKKFEEFELKLETEICARMEDVVSEAKCEVKKALVLVVLGCLTMFVLSKVI